MKKINKQIADLEKGCGMYDKEIHTFCGSRYRNNHVYLDDYEKVSRKICKKCQATLNTLKQRKEVLEKFLEEVDKDVDKTDVLTGTNGIKRIIKQKAEEIL